MKGAGSGHRWPTIGNFTMDGSGNFYIADSKYQVIEKYDRNGLFIGRWGGPGEEEGKFHFLRSMALDGEGNILASDEAHLHKFSPDGELIGRWGGPGYAPGEHIQSKDLDISKDGLIYRLEDFRIQVLRELPSPYPHKAIVVAAGGPSSGTWEQTQMNANFAYRALLYQGFPKDHIFYLSSDRRMDLDSNGKADDVSAPATLKRLDYALTDWAAGAEDVVIYLVGPGSAEGVALNGAEGLSADALAAGLDVLRPAIEGRIILVLDASCSGYFVDRLSAGASEKRIVISSTGTNEKARFPHQGSVSFSNYFWTRIFNGDDLGSAFNLARKAMRLSSHETQRPLLEANGHLPANDPADLAAAREIHIGNGTGQQVKVPVVAGARCESMPTDATAPGHAVRISATGVTASDHVARVWATITPFRSLPGAREHSVQGPFSVDLLRNGAGSYQAISKGMDRPGLYLISVYAMDRPGNVSLPVLTYYFRPITD